MADKDKDTVKDIATRLDSILTDPSFRKNIEASHQQYQRYKTDEKLEQTINRFLPSKTEQAQQKKIAI